MKTNKLLLTISTIIFFISLVSGVNDSDTPGHAIETTQVPSSSSIQSITETAQGTTIISYPFTASETFLGIIALVSVLALIRYYKISQK